MKKEANNLYTIPVVLTSKANKSAPLICNNIKKITCNLRFPKKITILSKLSVNYERLPKVSYINEDEDFITYSWEKEKGDNIVDMGVIYYKYVLDKVYIYLTIFSILLGIIIEFFFQGLTKLIELIGTGKQ